MKTCACSTACSSYISCVLRYFRLKQNNIEEASAEHRIKQIVDASNGRLTREAVLDSVLAAHIDHEPSLRYLVQEYHDGLLLYEISKREVWDAAATDTLGLTAWYKQHKKDYAWTEPHFKGYVYHLKNVKQEKDVKKFLKKHADGEWRKLLKETFNQDSVSVSISGPYLCKAGDNRYIDAYGFKKGNEELRDKVQGALEEMAADGTLTAVSEKWFGEDVTTIGK